MRVEAGRVRADQGRRVALADRHDRRLDLAPPEVRSPIAWAKRPRPGRDSGDDDRGPEGRCRRPASPRLPAAAGHLLPEPGIPGRTDVRGRNMKGHGPATRSMPGDAQKSTASGPTAPGPPPAPLVHPDVGDAPPRRSRDHLGRCRGRGHAPALPPPAAGCPGRGRAALPIDLGRVWVARARPRTGACEAPARLREKSLRVPPHADDGDPLEGQESSTCCLVVASVAMADPSRCRSASDHRQRARIAGPVSNCAWRPIGRAGGRRARWPHGGKKGISPLALDAEFCNLCRLTEKGKVARVRCGRVTGRRSVVRRERGRGEGPRSVTRIQAPGPEAILKAGAPARGAARFAVIAGAAHAGMVHTWSA